MSNTEIEKRMRVRRVWRAVAFGAFTALLFFMTVRQTMSNTAMNEVIAGTVVLGLIGLVCWLWPRYVATGFLLFVSATLAGSFLGSSEVNWQNAIVMLVPGLVPFLLFNVPDFLRWLKTRQGGMAG